MLTETDIERIMASANIVYELLEKGNPDVTVRDYDELLDLLESFAR